MVNDVSGSHYPKPDLQALGRANPPGKPGSEPNRRRLGRDASPQPKTVSPTVLGRANPPGEP